MDESRKQSDDLDLFVEELDYLQAEVLPDGISARTATLSSWGSVVSSIGSCVGTSLSTLGTVSSSG